MAGRGPASSGQRSRARDQKKLDERKVVVDPDDEVRGPDLPEAFHAFDGEEWVEAQWPPQTAIWWETWRTSAQAKTFTDTDWSFLLDTAVLHAEFWLGNRAVAAELRLRAAKFGATPEDRARLKIEIGTPTGGRKPPTRGAAKTAAGRKQRLLRVVDGAGEEA